MSLRVNPIGAQPFVQPCSLTRAIEAQVAVTGAASNYAAQAQVARDQRVPAARRDVLRLTGQDGRVRALTQPHNLNDQGDEEARRDPWGTLAKRRRGGRRRRL